eukprot:TRINITY_DN12505_c0_g1_i2.p1 TRINITY_DN12505_c0_g1~~TRINITY_DN12505_c0_g1_i2.p1  ORF type:complete len:124 (-),score=45.74 TRINITY_DN12505_c0_g1_i2:132-503(-)
MDRVRLVMVVVMMVMVVVVVEGQRKRPADKAREKKDLFWFKVAENSTSSCENVDEATLTEVVVEGPPAETCQANAEKWCFCGKKGKSCHYKLEIYLRRVQGEQTFLLQDREEGEGEEEMKGRG